MKRFDHFIAVLICGFSIIPMLQSCKNQQLINSADIDTGNEYCAPTFQYQYDPNVAPIKNTDSLLAAYHDMPAHEVIVANATGVLTEVSDLKAVQHGTSTDERLKKIELKATIEQRILTASVTIDAIAAELDCEGERADQLAGFLDNYNSKRTTRLTATSIALGAITTIASVAIKPNVLKNTVAIGGGLLSAGLGALTINSSHKKIRMFYPRNLLTDIWYAPDKSSVYPPFIWYVLNEKHFSNSGNISLIQSIRKRWIKINLQKELTRTNKQLYFGTGGVYKADELHSRASMLNELQSTIRSIHQDLQGFQLYMESR